VSIHAVLAGIFAALAVAVGPHLAVILAATVILGTVLALGYLILRVILQTGWRTVPARSGWS
jgi:uncharacterized protein involved in exopolysaccharide biosynthesis